MSPAQRKSFLAQFKAAKRDVARLRRGLGRESMRVATLTFPPLLRKKEADRG